MFTAKVLRVLSDGSEAQDVYEVRSSQWVCSAERKAVVLRMSNGDDAYIELRPRHSQLDDETRQQDIPDRPASEVILENAAGKTTEIYRA